MEAVKKSELESVERMEAAMERALALGWVRQLEEMLGRDSVWRSVLGLAEVSAAMTAVARARELGRGMELASVVALV